MIFAWLEYFKGMNTSKWNVLDRGPSDTWLVSSTDCNNYNSHFIVINWHTFTLIALLWNGSLFLGESGPRSPITLLLLTHNNSASSPEPRWEQSVTLFWILFWITTSMWHRLLSCMMSCTMYSLQRVLGKWVTQPSEIQPVPSSHVEMSLQQRQAQRARLH